MSYRRWVAQCLVSAFKAGDLTEDQLILRGTKTLGEPTQWLRELAKDTVRQFSKNKQANHHLAFIHFVIQHKGFQLASSYPNPKIIIRYIYLEPALLPAEDSTVMQLGLPVIPTEGELSNWLNLSPNDLLWLKNTLRPSSQQQQSKAHHYSYRLIMKKNGQFRLLEAPKALLKRVQKQIYQHILKPLPQSDYVHGFAVGRSCISHAKLHVGQDLLLKFDLQDFFPSIGFKKVYSQFVGLGYSHPVANALTALCTHQTPRHIILSDAKLYDALYKNRHLPQGSPASPMLANLAARHLDTRLGALAKKLGYRYSRYADDIVISGPSMKQGARDRLQVKVAAITLEEGFALNMRKSQAIKHSQRQLVTNIVVNNITNIQRTDFDAFKALLFNCTRFGPNSQNIESTPNFKAHLQGKIAYYRAINPGKTLKLETLFNRIDWPQQ